MRKSYTRAGLDVSEVCDDPLDQFRRWFDQARQSDLPEWMEINAMTLSTAGSDGAVTSRVVLLKGIEDDRFVFFTNYESVKARQIAENAAVSLCFFWPHLERQVGVQGRAVRTDRRRSEAYFHSRPRESQLGAWASRQSSVIADREVLQERFAALDTQYQGEVVPLPDHWGGYDVTPERIEFWQGRPSRLHDRIAYVKTADAWQRDRLSP